MNRQPSPYSDIHEGRPAKISVDLKFPGGRIVVDGVDLSHAVSAVRIVSRAGHLPEVELEIPAPNLTADVEGALRAYLVETDEQTSLGDTFRRGGYAGEEQT